MDIESYFSNIQTNSFISEKLYNGKQYYNFGINNLYPQELLEISDKSETHSACLEYKNLAIAGQGFTNVSEGADKFLKGLNYRTDFTTLLKKISLSLSIFDGFALQIIWNKTFTKIVDVKSTPFENIRVGKTDCWGNVEEFYINNNWDLYPTEYVSIKAYNKDKKKIKESEGLQLLYVINKSPKSLCYPNPRYTSSLNYIFSEYEMSIHTLSSITNGFTAGKMITFFGSPSTEDKEKNKRMFDKTFRGTANAGKYIINWAESAETKPNIEDLTPSTIVDQNIQASQLAQTKILLAHGITSPSLLGLTDGGSSIFSNGEELLSAYDVFFTNKIQPYHIIIEDSLNLILEGAGFSNEDFKIIPFSPVSVKNTTSSSTETIENTDINSDKNLNIE